MTEEATATTEVAELERKREEAEGRKASLRGELEQLDRYIDWLDQGIEIVGPLDGKPADLPLAKPEPEPPKPPPRKKPAKPTEAKSKATSQVTRQETVEMEARHERLADWLQAHPGEHKPRDVANALGYARPRQLGTDIQALVAAGRAVQTGWARGTRYASAEGKADAGEPPAADPGLEIGGQASALPDRKPEDHAERAAAARQRQNEERNSEAMDQVIAWVREHPDCSAAEISVGLGVRKQTIHGHIARLRQKGRVHSSEGKPPRYRAAEQGAFASDHRGAKTRFERELLDAVEKGHDTAEQLSIFLRRPEPHVRGCLIAMVRRQVLSIDSGKYSLAPSAGKASPEITSSNPSRDNDEGIHDELADAGLV